MNFFIHGYCLVLAQLNRRFNLLVSIVQFQVGLIEVLIRGQDFLFVPFILVVGFFSFFSSVYVLFFHQLNAHHTQDRIQFLFRCGSLVLLLIGLLNLQHIDHFALQQELHYHFVSTFYLPLMPFLVNSVLVARSRFHLLILIFVAVILDEAGPSLLLIPQVLLARVDHTRLHDHFQHRPVLIRVLQTQRYFVFMNVYTH